MRVIFFLVLSLGLVSCLTQRSIEYLQDPVQMKNMRLKDGSDKLVRHPQNQKIKPNDELLINVSSFDDVSFNYFNLQGGNSGMQSNNELALSTITYSVDVDGYIIFPILGQIKVDGLTTNEARELIRTSLAPYFNQPNVQVKYAFKKISVLGEVNTPGYYTYTKDQITILEAIAMARDLTIHGNRKEVQIIRMGENNEALKYEVDLTDDNTVFSYNYYLKSGDVIYVKPRKSVVWNELSTPISIFFSTITTALLVINAIQN